MEYQRRYDGSRSDRDAASQDAHDALVPGKRTAVEQWWRDAVAYRAAAGDFVGGEAPPDVLRAAADGGAPLPERLRAMFEARMGADFGDVRLHVGGGAASAAQAIQARAYTIGNDIVFGEGQYRPEDRDGQHLIAHELVHVVQQRGGSQRAVHRAGSDPVAPNEASQQLAAVRSELAALHDRGREAAAVTGEASPQLVQLATGIARLSAVLATNNPAVHARALAELRKQVPPGMLASLGDAPAPVAMHVAPPEIVEQRAPSVAMAGLRVSTTSDAAEVEAERVADTVMAGGQGAIGAAAAAVHRDPDGDDDGLGWGWIGGIVLALFLVLAVIAYARHRSEQERRRLAQERQNKLEEAQRDRERQKRLEDERIAKAEQERQAKEQAEKEKREKEERLNNERAAKAKKDQLKQEAKAKREEEERKAAAQRKRQEQARLAKQAEEERQQREELERLEAERKARKEEHERRALENKQRKQAEERAKQQAIDDERKRIAEDKLQREREAQEAAARQEAEHQRVLQIEQSWPLLPAGTLIFEDLTNSQGTWQAHSVLPCAQHSEIGRYVVLSIATVDQLMTLLVNPTYAVEEVYCHIGDTTLQHVIELGVESVLDVMPPSLFARFRDLPWWAALIVRLAPGGWLIDFVRTRPARIQLLPCDFVIGCLDEPSLDYTVLVPLLAPIQLAQCWNAVPRLVSYCATLVTPHQIAGLPVELLAPLGALLLEFPRITRHLTLAQLAIFDANALLGFLRKYQHDLSPVLSLEVRAQLGRVTLGYRGLTQLQCISVCHALRRSNRVIDLQSLDLLVEEILTETGGKLDSILGELQFLLVSLAQGRVVCVQVGIISPTAILQGLRRFGLNQLATQLEGQLVHQLTYGGDGVLFCCEGTNEYAETFQHKRLGEQDPLAKTDRKSLGTIKTDIVPFIAQMQEAAHQLAGLVGFGNGWGYENPIPGATHTVSLFCEGTPLPDDLTPYGEAVNQAMAAAMPNGPLRGQPYHQFVRVVRVQWSDGSVTWFDNVDGVFVLRR